MRSLPARHCQFCTYNIICSGWLMAKARYMDIILLASICRSLCIKSSGMLALLSQMSLSLSMGICIHASIWVRIRGCLRVCDVHVCVCCVLYLPPSEALVTALQQVLSSGGSMG